MFSRLQIVGLTLIAMGIAYGGYSLLVVPLVEPPPPVRREGTATEKELDDARAKALDGIRDRFRDLFRADEWELESPKVIESKQLVMLMRDYKTLDDGRLELKPCTLIFYSQGVPQPGQPASRAIVLQAPEGAVLEFENGLDLQKGRMGRLLGGVLTGEVTIRGKESQKGAGDDLEIVTKNVQMDPTKIWTPHDVKFQFGPNRGEGKDLTVLFTQRGTPNDLKPAGQGTPSGLKSIELVHVDRFHFDVSGGGLLPKGAIASKETKSPQRTQTLMPGLFPMPAADPREPSTLEITCKGPFLFDFVERVASFDDRVDVFRNHPNAPSDQLSCRTLEIYFDEKAKPAVGGEERGAEGKSLGKKDSPPVVKSDEIKPPAIVPKLQVKLLRASGTPVTVRAPSANVEARAERIEYDFASGTIRFDADDKLFLRQGLRELEAKRLEYTAGAEGQLGRLWALGPGRIRGRLSETRIQEFEARWGKHLLFRPQEGIHLLSLVEQASVQATDSGKLLSNEIHVWLREGILPEEPVSALHNDTASSVVRPPGFAPAAPLQPVLPAKPGKHEPKIGLVPDRVLATGDVHLDSAQLIAATKRLELWIEDRGGAGQVIRPATWQTPSPTAGAISPPPRAGPAAALTPRPQQFSLNGELMRLLIVRRSGETLLEDLTVEGQAELTEIRTPRPGEIPVVATGNILQLLKASGPDAALSVIGSPAEVRGRGFGLRGDRIQSRRQTSRIWVDGPGQMLLPGAKLDAAQPAAKPAGPTHLHIAWRGKLDFNGQRMMCDGGVSLQGDTQIGSCKILEAYLAQPVDLTQLAPTHDAQLAQVTLIDDVILENRTIEAGAVTAIDHLQLPRLSMDQRTGLLSGQGPGFLTSVRRGSMATTLTPNAAPPATATPPANPSAGLVFLRVDFQRGLSGVMQNREMKFLDQVRAVYGPVADWKQSLTYEMARQSPEAIRLRCDELAVMEMASPGAPNGAQQRPFELAATGDTLVEGRQFTAHCRRLSYAQAKDLLILEGDGRSDAELTHRQFANSPDSRAAARKILYWRNANRVEVDDARFLDLTQLIQQSQPPKPKKK